MSIKEVEIKKKRKLEKWEYIIEQLNLDVSKPVNNITAKQIKEISNEEPRLMAKIDRFEQDKSIQNAENILVNKTLDNLSGKEIRILMRRLTHHGKIVDDIIIPILTVLLALWIGRYVGRRDKVRSSCDTILRELLETKESLQGEESRIHYYFSESSQLSEITSIKIVDYRKNIIVTDVYDSILYSGLFTEFSSNTQHTLSTLYDRIKTLIEW